MSFQRPYSFVVACAVLTLGAVAAVRSSEPAHTPDNPGLLLPRSVRGEEALRLLGPDINRLAEAYQRTPAELRQILLTNQDLSVDTQGRMVYTCQGMKATAAQAAAGRKLGPQLAPPFPLADTFKLHSRPSSTKKIFLDFDGHVTSGTGWNSGGGDLTSVAWSLDGDRATFNDTERESIQRSFVRMSEAFYAFDVDITTEDPGVEALRKTNGADQAYGKRVIFSPTDDITGGTAGGVALLNSFTSNVDTPCFVFSDGVANNEKFMADCGEHEVGHTLGLNHDGTSTEEYYDGQGIWCPIMGAAYDKQLGQFSNGDYTNSSNQENDFAIMRTFGVALTDDFSNNVATPFNVTGSTPTVVGYIADRNDVDVFRIQTGAGPVTITAKPNAFGPTLDLKLEVLNETGTTVIQSVDSVADGVFGGSVSATLASGAYLVRIDGVGAGDSFGTGYSDYGSVGLYTLTATLKSPNPPVAPSSLIATATNSRRIDLNWTDNANNEDSFEVERKVGSGSFVPLAVLGPNVTTYADRSVSSGVTYTYRVRTANGAGVSAYSNEAEATPPFDPPTAPTLLAVSVSNGVMVVDWSAGGGIIDTYEVERRIGQGAFGSLSTVDGTLTILNDADLDFNLTYGYRVRSVGPGGISAWSNILAATTPPSAPSDLVVSGDMGGFKLNWYHPGNVGYRIERKVGSGPWTQIAQVTDDPLAETEEYVNTGFLPGVSATFRVCSFTSAGVSDFSNSATGSTLAGATSFSFNKSSAKANTTLKGKVEIAPAAPAGGVDVVLDGPNKLLKLPATVHIPAGTSSVTFNVKVKSVSKTQIVTATATYGASSRAATLTVKK